MSWTMCPYIGLGPNLHENSWQLKTKLTESLVTCGAHGTMVKSLVCWMVGRGSNPVDLHLFRGLVIFVGGYMVITIYYIWYMF
jgi:hypothetical protein